MIPLTSNTTNTTLLTNGPEATQQKALLMVYGPWPNPKSIEIEIKKIATGQAQD